MEDYVTVVSIDETVNNVSNIEQRATNGVAENVETLVEDSSFITVLSVNDDASLSKTQQQDIADTVKLNEDNKNCIESIVVYRLPGERLGFGLKFQSGIAKNDEKNGSQTIKKNEKVQRLFIQSCASDSPAARAKASWGFLKEGDEIISIDGQPVAEMTRIECVQCLKESNVAIKLEVRNGDGLYSGLFEDAKRTTHTQQQPPPPPPVPPRKLIRRKLVQEKSNPRDDKPFTPPPDAEYYINLFSDENSVLGECESDDTGSSISTIVDRFSICSTYSTESENSHSSNGTGHPILGTTSTSSCQILNKADLAKALRPFTLLEEEFNVDSSAKLEECLKKLDPDIRSLSLENTKQIESAYENVLVVSHTETNKTNKPIRQEELEDPSHFYENVEMLTTDSPKPKPRQIHIEPKKRSILPLLRKAKDENDKDLDKKTEDQSTAKPQVVVSKIPKATPPKQLRRAKTESEIKLDTKTNFSLPYPINIKEQCQLFLHNETGHTSWPGDGECEWKKPNSKIPIARLEKQHMKYGRNAACNSNTSENVKGLEKNLPELCFKKQKSETDLKLTPQNTFDPEKIVMASSSNEQPPKITMQKLSSSKTQEELTHNLTSSIPITNSNNESKVNFSIAPMMQPTNGFDEISVVTPIRTKSQISVLSPDTNECSFKTFSKGSEKRHIILNIAPDKERKILNVTAAQTSMKIAKEVPPPVIPNCHIESTRSKSQLEPQNENRSLQPKIKFTIQTYEGDKLDSNLEINDLNRPFINCTSQPVKPAEDVHQNLDKIENERKQLRRYRDAEAENEDNAEENEMKEENFIQEKNQRDNSTQEEGEPVVIGKCIKLLNIDTNYGLSSSSSSDEDEEKAYEIEDGEKLGPPEVVDGPGPSEAYFNFSWHSNMLPTIGEVEEEFSSLETLSRALAGASLGTSMKPYNKSGDAAMSANTVSSLLTKREISDNLNERFLEDVKSEDDNELAPMLTLGSIQTPESILPPSQPTTAVVENKNSIGMTLHVISVENGNKLDACNFATDKIKASVEIDDISNNQHQSLLEPIAQKAITSLDSNAIRNQSANNSDVDCEINQQVKMPKNFNETHVIQTNSTTTEVDDYSEKVLKTNFQVSGENLKTKESSTIQNLVNTKSASAESLKDKSVFVREDHIGNVDNDNPDIDKKEQKEMVKMDVEVIEKTVVEKSEPLLEQSVDETPHSGIHTAEDKNITELCSISEPVTKQEASSESFDIVNDLTTSIKPVEKNSFCRKSANAIVNQLSDKQLIQMTQAILNSERAMSNAHASIDIYSKCSILDFADSSPSENILVSTSLTSSAADTSPKIIDSFQKFENNLSAETSFETKSAAIMPVQIAPPIDSKTLNPQSDMISVNAKIKLENKQEQNIVNETTGIKNGPRPTQIENASEDNASVTSNIFSSRVPSYYQSIDNGGMSEKTESYDAERNRTDDIHNVKPIERIILGVENNQNLIDKTALQSTISPPAASDLYCALKLSENDQPARVNTISHSKRSEMSTTFSGPKKQQTKPTLLPKPTNIIDSNIKMDKSGIHIVPSSIILNDYISLSSPPTYSRLPPDGHEFPPNFSEPMIIPVKTATLSATDSKDANTKQASLFTAPEQQSNSNITFSSTNSDCPPLPKSTPPPTVPRKVYRQDLIIKVDDARSLSDKSEKVITLDQSANFTASSVSPLVPSSFESSRNKSSSISTLHNIDSYKPRPSHVRKLSDWRKDEKSEKSVRDKIAMFSTNEDRTPDFNSFNKTVSKPFNKSIENLLDSSSKLQLYTNSLTKRAMSVENLNDDYRPYSRSNSGFIERNKPDSTLYKSEITQSYSSLPRRSTSTLTRTTSFSGHDEGSRKASIANILEQRRKSMSKLRGLVIPERPSSNLETIIDLPEIKSKDSEKIKMNGFNSLQTTPRRDRHSQPVPSINMTSSTPSNGMYKSIFSSGHRIGPTARTSNAPAISIFKKSENLTLPPAKPPRTSLILSKSLQVEESDSDSVFSSKISSPPMSPRASVQEKFALTRTLSSETNTSIASSTTSTLTSGSGSQASCSSIGSTPTVDMSRKILRSGSGDSAVNRKNILASAKCRSGRDDSSSLARSRRYEDEDSTDGCDEEETRRAPKSKQRSISTGSNKSSAPSAPINYKLIDKDESIVDKIVNVASYVEITSDTDDSSRKSDTSLRKISAIFIDEERKASFKADPNVRSQLHKPEPAKRTVPVLESDDLAKWVQSEAAKAFRHKEKSTYKSSRLDTSALAEKFESNLGASLDSSIKAPIKAKTSTAEIREKFECRSQTTQNPIKPINSLSKPDKNISNVTYHERFSSLDSVASSSSGISISTQNASHQETTNEFASFTPFSSNQSLITAQDVQVLIEEADPPLKTPDAFIVVLLRETPESSIGITLAGGSDYEAKEITIHKILGNSPASKDGRLKRGDRILAINGLSMRGLTHRESITVLKTPRPEVVLVVTRSESVIVKTLSKKRSSLGSLTSLNDKKSETDAGKKIPFHKASRSLDLDLDIVSVKETTSDNKSSMVLNTQKTKSDLAFENDNMNENKNSAEVIFQQQTFIRGGGGPGNTNNKVNTSATIERVRDTSRVLATERQERVIINGDEVPAGAREVEVIKDNCGLGFSIEGGYDSPLGNRPLVVKKVFWGGAAQKAGNIKSGDEIICINGVTTSHMTRVDVWNFMKQLPMGPVKIVVL